MSCFFTKKYNVLYVLGKLFLCTKSTLRSVLVVRTRQFPLCALLSRTSYRPISTEDPGRFFRKIGGTHKTCCAPINLAILNLGFRLKVMIMVGTGKSTLWRPAIALWRPAIVKVRAPRSVDFWSDSDTSDRKYTHSFTMIYRSISLRNHNHERYGVFTRLIGQ